MWESFFPIKSTTRNRGRLWSECADTPKQIRQRQRCWSQIERTRHLAGAIISSVTRPPNGCQKQRHHGATTFVEMHRNLKSSTQCAKWRKESSEAHSTDISTWTGIRPDNRSQEMRGQWSQAVRTSLASTWLLHPHLLIKTQIDWSMEASSPCVTRAL